MFSESFLPLPSSSFCMEYPVEKAFRGHTTTGIFIVAECSKIGQKKAKS